MVKCIASGSKGNCWVLDDGKQILVIDCGVPVLEMKSAIQFQISRVVGCIVTHQHNDHAKYISQYEGCGLKVFKPYEQEEDFQLIRLGNYTIRTFPLVHDVRCFGFLIDNPVLGRTLYATDTEYIKYRFKGLNTVIVEANYANELLDDELEDTVKRNHVLRGHMELTTTQRFLQTNCGIDTKCVFLAHLSNENANRDKFLISTQPLIECPVWIAKKGLVII